MELAVHMKNRKTGKERIWKTNGENASHWVCRTFFTKASGSGRGQSLGGMFLMMWYMLAGDIM